MREVLHSMKRASIVAVLLAVAAAAGAAPNPASTAFTRAANSPAGHAAFDVAVDMLGGTESWHLTGMDVVPFYYEQGLGSYAETDLVFSSRNSLTRTSVGCASWATGPCYDVAAENNTPIPAALAQRGFNHVGGMDIGAPGSGPGAGMVFAPLETDNPRVARAYAIYDRETLVRLGLRLEEIPHRYNSWVAVDPSARYMVTAQDRWDAVDPLRVYEIGGNPTSGVTLTRRTDLDVVGSDPAAFPNFQGCKFDGPLTMYCANWNKRSSYFDVETQIHRIDLSGPIGTAGVTATSTIAFRFKAHGVAEQLTSNVPYGLETEDLAFWGGQLHVEVRGEVLGWMRVLHFARG